MCTDLLICNALIGHKTIGEDGHNGRAVVARVRGDRDYQGGADEKRLHNSAAGEPVGLLLRKTENYYGDSRYLCTSMRTDDISIMQLR